MPNRPSNAAAWYYEDFLPSVQRAQIYENQPEDWKRLRIWNGNELETALPEGFAGTPSEEQMQRMFEAMKQGNLFLFELGETAPVQYYYAEKRAFSLNPQEPVAPQPISAQMPAMPTVPNPDDPAVEQNLTQQQRDENAQLWEEYQNLSNEYNRENDRYQYDLERYTQAHKEYTDNVQHLGRMGDGFLSSVEKINQERQAGMQQEQNLRDTRQSSATLLEYKRKRDSADEVITQIMAPRPQTNPRVFYEGDPNVPKDMRATHNDAIFRYKVFDEQMEANGYDLPANNKISEYDAATIHFALVGSAEHMKTFVYENMEKGGPLMSQNNALDWFNMMMTGMFGINRKNQAGIPMIGEAFRLGKDVIGKYIDGDPKPLGELLGDSARSIMRSCAGYGQQSLTTETVAASKLVERMLDLLDKHPDLKAASKLQEQELNYMRGYVKMGEAYDRYLDGKIKLNEAAGMDKPLSQEEKLSILADAAIQEMLNGMLAKEVKDFEASDAYNQLVEEAILKDGELQQQEDTWLKENGYTGQKEDEGKAEYRKHNDLMANAQAINNAPLEHDVLNFLGKTGNLERLRAQLMADPAIAKLAQKSEAELKALVESKDGIKQLTEQAQKAQDVVINASAWYENLKTQMLDGRPENDLNAISPWLNANVASDADRLLIAVTNEDGSKTLTTVASLLENGMEDLRNPSAATMELMYRNALEGNLYYYDVGKDMPMRLQADGQQTALEQLEFHEAPTFWMRLANFLTFGYAYADIVHPQADRDPAAYDAFMQVRGARGEAAQNEAASRHDQARSSAQESIGKNTEMMMNFTTPNPGAKVTYPKYKPEELDAKMAEVQKADRHLMTKRVQEIHDFTIMTIGMMQKEDVSKVQLLDMMAKLVLVEAAKQEMALNNQKPGPISEGLENHFFANLDAMKNNKTFQKFTENISKDMVEHFLMTDGAKNMHKAIQKDMLKDAKQQTGEEKERSMEMDNNKQNEMNLF